MTLHNKIYEYLRNMFIKVNIGLATIIEKMRKNILKCHWHVLRRKETDAVNEEGEN